MKKDRVMEVIITAVFLIIMISSTMANGLKMYTVGDYAKLVAFTGLAVTTLLIIISCIINRRK